MLDVLGFSRAADLIYSRLVAGSPQSLDELARTCDLDPATVTAEVRRLVEQGVLRDIDDTGRYTAVAPDFAIESLVQAREDELRAVRAGAQQLASLYRSAQRTESTALVELVEGTENVRRTSEQLQMIAKSQIRGLTRPPYLVDPTVPNEVEVAKLANSVRFRCVWDRSALEIPGVFEAIQADMRNGEETRIFDGVPTKLTLCDDDLALVSMTHLDAGTCDALVVKDPELIRSLSTLFELIWQSSRPVARPSDREAVTGSDLDHRSHELLQMLGTGMTDESIARCFGWSVRTVQRHVRRIMDVLGVETRLQAGVEAAKRGWL
jgi:DNA-binding CsgD family transcriptional regulator/predicted transcriptional regulator